MDFSTLGRISLQLRYQYEIAIISFALHVYEVPSINQIQLESIVRNVWKRMYMILVLLLNL